MELFSNIAAGVLVNMITEASKRIWNWTKQMSQKDKTFIADDFYSFIDALAK